MKFSDVRIKKKKRDVEDNPQDKTGDIEGSSLGIEKDVVKKKMTDGMRVRNTVSTSTRTVKSSKLEKADGDGRLLRQTPAEKSTVVPAEKSLKLKTMDSVRIHSNTSTETIKEDLLDDEKKENVVKEKSSAPKHIIRNVSISIFAVALLSLSALVVGGLFESRVLYIGKAIERTEQLNIVEGQELLKTHNIETKYGQSFSIQVPRWLLMSSIDEKDVGVYVFESDAIERSFQVVVKFFTGEDRSISSSFIQKEIPGAKLDTVEQKEVGDGIKTLTFWAEDEKNGLTREVWILKKSVLYQITAYQSFDAELSKIFSTLRFY